MTTGGVKDTVDRIIRTHKVAIFSRQGCPYCLGARNTIRKFIGKELVQTDVAFCNIDKEHDTRETQNYLKLISGASSVPIVFIHGKYIGNHEKLTFLYRTGELDDLLKAGPTVKRKSSGIKR